MKWRMFTLALLVGLTAGCDAGRIFCGPTAVFAVQVEVYDAVTSRPAAERATLIIRDGAYVDSTTTGVLSDGARPLLLAGYERPGTYDVLVRRAGYRDWQRQGVRATSTGSVCRGLEPALLEARLEPVPAG